MTHSDLTVGNSTTKALLSPGFKCIFKSSSKFKSSLEFLFGYLICSQEPRISSEMIISINFSPFSQPPEQRETALTVSCFISLPQFLYSSMSKLILEDTSRSHIFPSYVYLIPATYFQQSSIIHCFKLRVYFYVIALRFTLC